ncbi:MAG: serine/threonine-protein phosphatase [Verrucomicrobia bacterium]|nr:MAG: serine/threonine-protein phosphatase [Verrucomicrobiota bacterium]
MTAARKKQSPTADTLRWSGWTDTGKVRKNNEDSFLGLQFDAREVHRLGKHGEASTQHTDFAFAVCDGMGGAKAGEYASRIAVEKTATLLPRSFANSARGLQSGWADVLTELFGEVHRALVYLGGSYEECHHMQTTMSLCWFTPGWMYFGHIGDSRIYYLSARADHLIQLTHDDTHVGWLFRQGKISAWEARNHPRRNLLQKALGGANQFVEPHVGAVECNSGDIFLLCSDGLNEGLFDENIAELLRHGKSARITAKTAHQLVDESVKRDGRDNTTALVIQIG